jgi:hypothetical protein
LTGDLALAEGRDQAAARKYARVPSLNFAFLVEDEQLVRFGGLAERYLVYGNDSCIFDPFRRLGRPRCGQVVIVATDVASLAKIGRSFPTATGLRLKSNVCWPNRLICERM